MKIATVSLLLVPTMAFASSAFDGTWKLRPDSTKTTGKADQFQVLDGTYTCSSCVPEINVKADGSDQKVKGHDYYDTVAVTVVSPSSIRIIDKKEGKRALAVNYEVSTDGNALTGKFEDYTGTQVANGTFTETRRAPGPPGSHRVSGLWQPTQLHEAKRCGAHLWLRNDGRSVQHALERPELQREVRRQRVPGPRRSGKDYGDGETCR